MFRIANDARFWDRAARKYATVPLMQLVGKAPYVAVLAEEDLEREIAAAGFETLERARHASRGRDARPFLVTRKL